MPDQRYNLSRSAWHRTSDAGARPLLTACILVSHQTNGLDSCLKSVAGLADEVVIVTTRPTDEIAGTAQAVGAKVISKRWRNSFSAARNAAIEAASGHWILSLDADEWLEPSSAKQVKRALRQQTFDGWLISTRNLLEPDAQGECFLRSECRLFRNSPLIRFERSVCESVEHSIAASGGEVAALSGASITSASVLLRPGQREWDRGLKLHLIARELRSHPLDPELLLNLGFEHYCSGSFVLAQQALEAARQRVDRSFPQAALLFSLLVVCLRETGNTDRGLAVSLEARSLGIASPELEFATAWTHMARREYAEAADRFAEALAAAAEAARAPRPPRWSDPTIAGYRASMGLALALLEGGQVRKALPHAARAVEGAANRPEPWVLLGCVYHLMGSEAQARRSLENALELDPSHHDALSLILPLYQDSGDLDKALRTIDLMLEKSGNLPELVVRKSAILCDSGRLDEAAELALEACGLAGDLADLQMDAGKVLAACGRNTEALACFDRAVELAPQQAYPLFGAGDLFYKLGAYRDAMEAYAQGLEIDPGNAAGYFALGNACIKCGHLELAIKHWERAVELKPDHHPARTNLKIARSTLSRAA